MEDFGRVCVFSVMFFLVVVLFVVYVYNRVTFKSRERFYTPRLYFAKPPPPVIY